MNRGILIKAGIVLGAFILVFGLAFGCEAIKNNDKTPELKDSDNVYVTVDGIDVTDGELYEEMMISNGLSYLLQYAEEQLMEDYLKEVTDAELLAEKELMIYGTDDPILLAEYKADTELNDALVEQFEETMILLALDPNDIDDLRIYLALSIAKQQYTRDYILGVESTDPLYIGEDDVQQYYDDKTKGDVYSLDIRFHSKTEAENVLNSMNLVPNYDGVSWGLYDPASNEDTPIDEVDTFTDDFTTVLTDDQAFAYFIDIYNYMNGTTFDRLLSQDDFMAANMDLVQHNYEEMTRGESTSSYVYTFVNYIWDTLALPVDGEDASVYSYKVQSIGDFAFISYKLAEDDVPLYATLTDTEKEDLKMEYLDTQLSSSSLEVAMEERWLENELEIFDPILKLQYNFQEGIEFDNNGSNTIIATLGNEEITPRVLFDYMTENFGMYTALEIAQIKSLLQSDLYDEVYVGVEDYLNSDNETMKQHVEDLEGFKQYFASDGFASYGLSSEDYTWEEFLVLYLQCDSEIDVLEEISIAGNLQTYLINDTINYEAAVDYINDQVANYFSLNAEHLLIFVDKDFDFTGDDYSDFLDSLDAAETAEYEALVESFSLLVQDKVKNEEMTLDEIVTEYQDTLIEDAENVWAPYKKYGFFIVAQDLSSTASLTYASTNGYYDATFVEELKRVYDAYVLEIENSATKPEVYNDDRVFATDFGVHYIVTTEGSDFDQPSAIFDNADGDYVDGNVGTTDAPNKTQVELFIDIQFSSKLGENNDATLEDGVEDALATYYSALYDLYWPTSENSTIPVTIMTVGYALDNNITFTDDNDTKVADLEAIYNQLLEINFPENFITGTDQ